MKTLISWIAFNNDFKMEDGNRVVDENGPTMTMHRLHFEGYDLHLILSQEKDDDERWDLLRTALTRRYPKHRLENRLMGIQDVINLEEIKSKVEALLTSLPRDEKIDIFISPGTPAMQSAWYILQMTQGRARRLLQLRKKDGKQEELVEAHVQASQFPIMAILSTQKADQPIDHGDFFIAESIRPTYELAYQAASAHGVPVLIKGETGTGKEHLARTIHEQSARKDRDFKAINCGALTESILESQLFGYEKGAFTGAQKPMKGIFQSASGGTVFLDEIAELSPKTQTALLRVLQSGEVWPLMASKPIKVDIRIVAASHRDLYQCCLDKTFRWDLYYRLAVIELELPPLAQWTRADRNELLKRIAAREASQMKAPQPLTLEARAREAILDYPFPGNIREMENLVRRLLAFQKGKTTLADLPSFIHKPRLEASLRWEDAEKAHIQKVLHITEGNQERAKELLGYGSINTLRSRIKEYRIKIPEH